MTPEDTLSLYEKLINQHDFDALIPLICPNAVFWFSDGSFSGHIEIRRAFEKTWATLNNDTYWLSEINWMPHSATLAGCTYQFNWETTISGRKISGNGRGTTVLAQQSEKWQIIHEHLSANPA